MANITPLEVSSYEELLNSLEIVAHKFKTDTVVAIRGANLSIEQQRDVARKLGDILGWYPNTSTEFEQIYQENHARVTKKADVDGDTVCLDWHLEHVDYDNTCSIMAGIWNMTHFTADPETGKTYFVDTSAIFNSYPEEWRNFLRKSIVTWTENDLGDRFYSLAVRSHWLTHQEVIRIDIDEKPEHAQLHSFEGRKPTDEEKRIFSEIYQDYVQKILKNEQFRLVHRWQQGDLVIPDLFKSAHAVTGGFDSKDREFTGFWVYAEHPELNKEHMELLSGDARLNRYD